MLRGAKAPPPSDTRLIAPHHHGLSAALARSAGSAEGRGGEGERSRHSPGPFAPAARWERRGLPAPPQPPEGLGSRARPTYPKSRPKPAPGSDCPGSPPPPSPTSHCSPRSGTAGGGTGGRQPGRGETVPPVPGGPSRFPAPVTAGSPCPGPGGLRRRGPAGCPLAGVGATGAPAGTGTPRALLPEPRGPESCAGQGGSRRDRPRCPPPCPHPRPSRCRCPGSSPLPQPLESRLRAPAAEPRRAAVPTAAGDRRSPSPSAAGTGALGTPGRPEATGTGAAGSAGVGPQPLPGPGGLCREPVPVPVQRLPRSCAAAAAASRRRL